MGGSINDALLARMGGQDKAGRTRLDDTGRIAEHVHCVGCGYDLFGLAPRQPCPECGANLWPALVGDNLGHAPPGWLRIVSWGLLLLMLGIILSLFWGVVGGCAGLDTLAVVGRGGGGVELFFVAGVEAAILSLTVLGVWWATAVEPRPAVQQSESAASPRVLARWFLLISALLEAALLVGGLLRPDWLAGLADEWVIGLGGGVQVVYLAGLVALFIYARRLAERVPDFSLGRHCLALAVALIVGPVVLVLLGVGAFFVGQLLLGMVMVLGFLIFVGLVVWSLVLIYRLQQAVAGCIAEAEANLAEPGE